MDIEPEELSLCTKVISQLNLLSAFYKQTTVFLLQINKSISIKFTTKKWYDSNCKMFAI